LLKIGWFSTARGDSSRKLLQSIFESIQSKHLNARIDFVFCSREPGESEKTDVFLNQVKDYGIPLVCLSVRKFADQHKAKVGIGGKELPEWRIEYDRQVMKKLMDFKPDICVLAGYMLIVGPEMCSKYHMINLHPALPDGPTGTWQEVIWNLIEEGAAESGAMMHFVTPDLDRGPVITYCRFLIRGSQFDDLRGLIGNRPIAQIKLEQGENNELFKAIRQAGFIREIPLIIHTLKAFSEGKISIRQNDVLHYNTGEAILGCDLTQEIDAAIASLRSSDK
jgi:phosphoribosylglycinamide formyltransferase 1